MCTMIAETLPLPASATNGARWFRTDHLYLAYDHPTHAHLDHALGIDFVRDADGLLDGVDLELDLDAARALRDALTRTIAAATHHA